MLSVWVDRCQTIGLAHNSRKENISDNRSHERIKQTAHFGGVAFLASHRRWFEHTYSLMHQAWTADRFICESALAGGQLKVRSHTTLHKLILQHPPNGALPIANALALFFYYRTRRFWRNKTTRCRCRARSDPPRYNSVGESFLWREPSDAVIYSHSAVCIKVFVLFCGNIAARGVTPSSLTAS